MMFLFIFFHNIKCLRFSISWKILQIIAFLRFIRYVICWLFRFLRNIRILFIQHFVPIVLLQLHIKNVGIIQASLRFCRYYLLYHWNVPVVYFAGFSVSLETDWNFLFWLHKLGMILRVIMLIRWQFYDEHVGIVRTAMVTGLDRQTFCMRTIWRSNTCKPQFC